MNKTVYIFLADGFEEMEAIIPIDFLRRAGCLLTTIGVTGKIVTGAHGIQVAADIEGENFVLPKEANMVVLPGGQPGTDNLTNSQVVKKMLEAAILQKCYIAAICAAPTVLHKYGIVKAKNVTAFPSVKNTLTDCVYTGNAVEVDGNVITARSAGVAFPFAFKLAQLLVGQETAQKTMNNLYPEK